MSMLEGDGASPGKPTVSEEWEVNNFWATAQNSSGYLTNTALSEDIKVSDDKEN